MFAVPSKVLLVCGGRDFTQKHALHHYLHELCTKEGVSKIVTGDCPTGADAHAREFAEQYNIGYKGYPARWSDMSEPCIVRRRQDGTQYNACAGSKRNLEMFKQSHPDIVLATVGGPGTLNMLSIVRAAIRRGDDIKLLQPIFED